MDHLQTSQVLKMPVCLLWFKRELGVSVSGMDVCPGDIYTHPSFTCLGAALFWLQEQPDLYSLLWTFHVGRTCWISPKVLCKMVVMCIFIWIIYINYIIVTHAPQPTCTLVMHRTQRLSAFTMNHAIRLHPSGKLSLKWPFSYIPMASTTILFN